MAIAATNEWGNTISVRDQVRLSISAVLGARRMKPIRLAELIEMNPQHLYKRLRGETTISVEDIAVIADALGVPVQLFFDGTVNVAQYAARDSNPEPTGYGLWPPPVPAQNVLDSSESWTKRPPPSTNR